MVRVVVVVILMVVVVVVVMMVVLAFGLDIFSDRHNDDGGGAGRMGMVVGG